MKTRKLEMQYQEWMQSKLRDAVRKVALFCVLLWAPQDWLAQNISGVNDGALTTDVVKKDAIHQKITMMPSSWIEQQQDVPWIEPDPDDDDKDQGTLPEDWTDQVKEKSESWASFSRQTWVWYSVTGWEAMWVNRLCEVESYLRVNYEKSQLHESQIWMTHYILNDHEN